MTRFDPEALLSMTEVPEELVPHRAPVSEGLTYESLMALMRRLGDNPWGAVEPVHPDVFEASRRAGETRRQAKTRIMLEAHVRDGGQIHDSDLWKLRAQYVYVRSFVQGRGQGLQYDTDNWVHFYNRYGMGGRDPEIMVGLWKSTVEEMGRMSMIESQSIWAMRLLGH